MTENVVHFPAPPEAEPLMVGPLQYHQVIVEGRAIPGLSGHANADGTVTLTVDRRFSADFPDEATARQAAWLVAQGLAIGQGYTHLGATSKDQPFAPLCSVVGPVEVATPAPVTEAKIESAREAVRSALHAADNGNHAGEMAVLKMAVAPDLAAAAAFAIPASVAIEALCADVGGRMSDDHEVGRIEESSGSPSFRIKVGHIRRLAAALAAQAQGPTS